MQGKPDPLHLFFIATLFRIAYYLAGNVISNLCTSRSRGLAFRGVNWVFVSLHEISKYNSGTSFLNIVITVQERRSVPLG